MKIYLEKLRFIIRKKTNVENLHLESGVVKTNKKTRMKNNKNGELSLFLENGNKNERT